MCQLLDIACHVQEWWAGVGLINNVLIFGGIVLVILGAVRTTLAQLGPDDQRPFTIVDPFGVPWSGDDLQPEERKPHKPLDLRGFLRAYGGRPSAR